tara:strand:- start:410 stop:874 length:465 start_codon:yes stop_codon:yes gene_type:complete
MIKAIIKTIYSAFISIVLISFVLAGWTSYTFISQSSKSSEIAEVIKDMYRSQKSFFNDVIELSKLLIKDTSKNRVIDNSDLLLETELTIDLENNSQLLKSPINADNGDNPLGIVIEPSLTEVGETKSPDLVKEPLIDEEKKVATNEMEIGMEMN